METDREIEELSKIKYSIEDMVRKREDLKMKESLEAKFASTLNQILGGGAANTTSYGND